MTSWHCPGAVITVIKEDEVLHQGAYGLRDVEANLPMTPATRFPIASVTKSFTAMCVALLVDEGKLEWDTPVRDYAPEFILDDAYVTQHMTVRDILSHRTGLPGHFWATDRIDIELTEFVSRMKYLKFNSSFREKWQYNNALYYALAYLIEKLSGQTWGDFVQNRILDPLSMTASNFSPQSIEDQEMAEGYRVKRDEDGAFSAVHHVPFAQSNRVSLGAAGGLFSTLTDMVTWLKLHMNNGDVKGSKLVSSENLRQMHAPQMVIPVDEESKKAFGLSMASYGMGWFIEPYKGYTLVSHSGEVEGHTVWVGFVPEEKVSVITLTNLTHNPLPSALLREGLDRALNLPSDNWNAKLHNLIDSGHAKQLESSEKAREIRISDSPMSHPPKDYVGIYEAEGYPDFAVKFEDDRLRACTVGGLDWGELRHYHYDTFEWHVFVYDFWMKFRFSVNVDGEIDSAFLPLEPAVGDIVFRRKVVDNSEPA